MNTLPSLTYYEWKDTYETLHRWVQIIGKIRLCKEPWINHSWSSTLYVTPRGLGTSAISLAEGIFSIEFDFIDHKLIFSSSNGKKISIQIQSETVVSFYTRVMNVLSHMKIDTDFDPRPNELLDVTPFLKDTEHRTYNPVQAYKYWQILIHSYNVMKLFRSQFVGKCSPVHFFWGSFDLAVSRFSGRLAPEHPGGIPHLSDKVVKEAYSHEVCSCGFWPGNEAYPQPAYYSYTYPEPEGFSATPILPNEAFYHQQLHEFILPYSEVQQSQDPGQKIISFFQSTYDAAANLGKWDRELLEHSPPLLLCQQSFPKEKHKIAS